MHDIQRISAFASLACAMLIAAAWSAAGESADATPPPLPLHTVEGTGGTFTIQSAYLVNPPAEGSFAGLPSLGNIYVHIGRGRYVEALSITETLALPAGRGLEFGYAFNSFGVGDLDSAVLAATGIRIREESVGLHHFNARLNLLKDGEFDQAWLPAVTVGLHYKYNDTINDLDDQLLGTLTAQGIDDNDGLDYTAYASKLLPLPLPVMLSGGVRATEAAHIGFLGFTGDYEFVAEGSVCVFLTPEIVISGEYRQKPHKYTPIPGLVDKEDDWWSLCAGYIVDSHLTIAAGYANFGDLLNHRADAAVGLAVKYEF